VEERRLGPRKPPETHSGFSPRGRIRLTTGLSPDLFQRLLKTLSKMVFGRGTSSTRTARYATSARLQPLGSLVPTKKIASNLSVDARDLIPASPLLGKRRLTMAMLSPSYPRQRRPATATNATAKPGRCSRKAGSNSRSANARSHYSSCSS
jgi:hypothetical protein